MKLTARYGNHGRNTRLSLPQLGFLAIHWWGCALWPWLGP